MKYILFALGFILIGCKAQQQIVPLETKEWPTEGTYYKDLDNDLEPYIGTWRGIFENKIFTITFSKYKGYNSMGNYYKDRIRGKYKMTDTNGNQLYSTYNILDEDVKVNSLGFVDTTKKKLRLSFVDLCIEGQIVLNFENTSKTQIHWKYYTQQSLVTDDSSCAPYNEMPRGEMTLVKQ